MTRMPKDVDRLESLPYGDLPSSRRPRSPFVYSFPIR
jgi:hypothetical protein